MQPGPQAAIIIDLPEDEAVPRGLAISRYAHVDTSTLPTLFPHPVAAAVTALATSARYSLRISAFFIELILEGTQYSTHLTLGTARRILIAAISSARRIYLLSNPVNQNLLTHMKIGDTLSDPASTANFLDILDKYTNLGIYMIHHAFTLAELFTMSGFYLTTNAIHTAHIAAQESVELFDSLFGSTDSSRALSAIITLLRKELLEDERFKGKDKGAIRSLAALTKALTAFACLQTATWERTSSRLKMKMLYDCTVIKEKDQMSRKARKVHVSSEPLNSMTTMAAPEYAIQEEDRAIIDEVNGKLWAHLNDPPPSPNRASPADLSDIAGHTAPNDYFEMSEEFAESTTVTHTYHLGHRRMQSAPSIPSLSTLEISDDWFMDPAPQEDHLIFSTRTDRTRSHRRTFRRIPGDQGIPDVRAIFADNPNVTIEAGPHKAPISPGLAFTPLPTPGIEEPSAPPPTPRYPTVDPVTLQQKHRRLPSLSHLSPESSETDTPENIFPHDTLLNNIHRFMRFSSAAYGQNFLRILGLGSTDFTFPSTSQHHANTWAFAQHTNLPIDSMILSSFAETTPTIGPQRASTLVHYLAVDHERQAVILTCRGTLGLSDVLTDLTCDYCSVEIEGDSEADYYAHSGMYRSALGLTSRKSSVHQALVMTLQKYKTYGLVVTGHSLGGGVAALLSIASSMPAGSFMEQNAKRDRPVVHPPISTPFVTSFASGLPPGRPVHCYTYGVPAIASPDLAEYTKGLITSVIHNSDIVPTLSLGVLRDLKNVAVTLFEEGNVTEEIVTRVLGVYTKRFSRKEEDGASKLEKGEKEDSTSDWMTSLIKTMRADMDNDKLYPPGDVYIMEYHDVFVTIDGSEDLRIGERVISHKQAQRVTLQKCESVIERFGEPLFSKTMLKDHMPTHYERATQLLVDGVEQYL